MSIAELLCCMAIFLTLSSFFFSPSRHPIHLHGFNMYVLHEGPGTWDGTIINKHNPQRRDVVQMQANGHLVIQFDAAENAGLCHFPGPLSLSLSHTVLTYISRCMALSLPHSLARLCRVPGSVPHKPGQGREDADPQSGG